MKEEIFEQCREAITEFTTLLFSFSQSELNEQPYENNWTAAQVGAHVIKSNKSITQALNMEAEAPGRPPDERVQELKDIFLDFTTPLKSPDFILPEKGIYKKETLQQELSDSVEQLNAAGKKVDLAGTICHVAFGDITKLELLHFVVYHTKRHSHQLSKIYRFVKTNHRDKK